MQTITARDSARESIAARARMLFHGAEDTIHRRTDRMFAGLMLFQWLAGILAAFWISPKTWIGATSHTHLHVWAAIFLGGGITGFPVFLAWRQPGAKLTRHTIGVAQMLYSALLIHLTGGRIETHFHVFGSLAFLAFYRDWRVLLSATVVVAADHFLRGMFWPQSVFGVLTPAPWRWLEHAGWVLFEDTFLLISISQSLKDMFGLAERQASLEAVNAGIEQKILERTAELTRENLERRRAEEALRESQGLYHSLVEQLPVNVYRKDGEGRFVFVNSRYCHAKGLTADQVLGKTEFEVNSRESADQNVKEHELIMRTGRTIELEEAFPQPDGAPTQYFQVVKLPVLSADGSITGTQGINFDITQRKQAEEKLNHAHRQLVDASRQAGMAEVAASVLHNVGNVLNSVNVSSSLIVDKVRNSKVGNITRVVALIKSHEHDLGDFFGRDPRGRQLPAYLTGLAAHLAEEQDDISHEAGSLVSNIVHIKEIVALHQNYARTSGVVEFLLVTDLLEDAVRMNFGALERHNVKLLREYSPVAPALVEKHKVLQILVNLIRNAKYACDDSGKSEKQITLRVSNSGERIRIAVVDNGIGIPAENLTRIFSHGFTTRKEGHGFGLHSGALAAKEMGGSLAACSDGPGCGATFTLDLPLRTQSGNL